MNRDILSLFDGMSIGQIALNRSGVTYDKYYASEINPYPIAVTQHHYPETIQLGDVQQIDFSKFEEVYMIIGGSPCTDFSFAGTRRGSVTEDNVEVTDYETYMDLKESEFKFKGQSYLFWEFVRALKQVRHRYFFLENVIMDKKWEDVISKALGLYPVRLNSSLVSAQNRDRLYWTNIPGYKEPADKGIYLKDIIESGSVDREKSLCIDAVYFKGGTLYEYFEKKRRQLVYDGPVHVGNAYISGNDQIKRVYDPFGKAPTLTSMRGGHREPKVLLDKKHWRKLTPKECERLQTVPDDWTLAPWKNRMMSNSRRYEMLGNGWTVDAIVEFFKNLKDDPKPKKSDYCQQLSFFDL